MKNISDLLKNRIYMSDSTDKEKVKQVVESTLKSLMNGSDQIISNYKVEIVEDSPEIQIIREVLEEPNDTINFNIVIQQPPINYIEFTFNVEPGIDLDKIDEIIEEINDEPDEL